MAETKRKKKENPPSKPPKKRMVSATLSRLDHMSTIPVVPTLDLPEFLRGALCSIEKLSETALYDNGIQIQIQGSPLHEVIDWLRKKCHYKDFGTCMFPSNHAVLGCLGDGHTEVSPVMTMKPGQFHVLTAPRGKLKSRSDYSLFEQCLFLHESFAADLGKTLSDATWTSFNVPGRFSAAMLDFDSFFTGEKRYDKKVWYETWLDKPVGNNMERLHNTMPELAAELEPIIQAPSDSTAALMHDLVSAQPFSPALTTGVVAACKDQHSRLSASAPRPRKPTCCICTHARKHTNGRPSPRPRAHA